MTDYRTELEKAITGADNLICAVNAVGDAMDTGGSAAGYVGAVRVLAQAAEAHALDLKAMRLCMTWDDKAREEEETSADQRKTLFDLDAELLEARVLIERVRTLLALVCEDFFNETQNDPRTPEGQADIARAFDENRVLCWTANACTQTLDTAIANMTAIMKAMGVTA